MSETGYKDCFIYQLSLTEQAGQEVSENQLDERILIIGSGRLECLRAIALAEQGKEVNIVEASDEILRDCLASPKRADLMRKLEKLVVRILLETSVVKVSKNQVCLCNLDDFKTTLSIDNIIIAKGE